MKRNKGYIGTEIELLILNEEGKVVDAFKEIAKKLPRRELGRKHVNIELSRVTHDVWGSQPEVNIMPFWEDQFEEFQKEIGSLMVDLYETAKRLGYRICLLPLPPSGHLDPMVDKIYPRDAETQSVHYHYSKDGGFPDRISRLPYYNAFVLTYAILLPTTLTSFYGFGKERNYLGARFHLGTALFPPPYIELNKQVDHEYMYKEIQVMRKEMGLLHPVPGNIRLFDVSFLTKEEAYWLIPRKSTVEMRPFDVVPSLLIIQALWMMIAAIGKKVIKHENSFLDVGKEAFRVIWRFRQRVIKRGFRARIPKVDPRNLPVIGDERWPRYLYDREILNARDALLWLINDLEPEFEEMGYNSGLARRVLQEFKKFVAEGLTPSERIKNRCREGDIVKCLLDICEEAVFDPFFVP
ncbi:MAG: hypothetical protein ACP6IP_06830 [Candidatus Njordarchaeia archaeon]